VVFAAEDAFEADNEVLDASSKHNIEHFHTLKNITVENKADNTLTARLFIRNQTLNAPEYYETTVKNLKEVSPKLQTLDIFGGHVFYPTESTTAIVKTEIETIKTNIHSLLKALKKEDIKLTSNVFTFLIIVDENTHVSANAEELIAKTFTKEAIVDDSNEDGLELLYNFEDTDVHLYILFLHHLDQVTKTQLPHGYTSYARAVKLHLNTIFEKLEAKAAKQTHIGESKLFLPGVERLNRAGDVHVEDFYAEKFNSNITDTTPQKALIQLLISLGVPNVPSVPVEEFYEKAVANLKKSAPSLKRVVLDGGYAFNPQKPTSEDIKNEIAFFKELLTAALKAFKNAQIEVVFAKLKLFWLTTQKEAGVGGYPALFKAAFDQTDNVAQADVEGGRIFLHFELEGAPIVVHVNFFDQAPATLGHGRTSFYEAAELNQQSSEIKQH